MSTNSQIIRDALGEIAVLSEVETASAEQGADALRKLNQMMEEWEEAGIRLQYTAQTSTSDTFPCPAFCEDAVISALAIRLAPSYGATVPIELGVKADAAYQRVLRKCLNKDLPEASLAHMPQGAHGTWNIETDR